MKPTIAGFIEFLRGVVGIDAGHLPDASPVISAAYSMALALVNPAIACLDVPNADLGADPTAWSLYAYAVYNLAADRVINFAPEQTGDPFFPELRRSFGIATFVPGVTASSSDSGTSQSRLNPEFMKNLTLRDLQNLKTPYGRAYLEIVQDYGPSVWGIS